MAVATDNLNLNLNLNLGTPPDDTAGYGRPRYNTEDYPRLIPANQPNAIPLPRDYSLDWSPDHRAWELVEEFILKGAWNNMTPIDFIKNQLDNNANNIPVPKTNKLTPAILAQEVIGVANASLDRPDRALEIVDQANAAGALNYWLGLLRLDPAQEKNCYLLMLVGRKIGEYVAMGLKARYRMRRPSQVYPHLMPLIDPPDTPSFPSSHSLQAHLISGLLKKGLRANAQETARALDHLAQRVARNREIAGVHYPMDSASGEFAAGICLNQIDALIAPNAPAGRFKTLVQAAATELRDHRA